MSDLPPISPTQRVRAVVIGRVQGVGYRYWVVKHAQALRLSGWVRNRDDGNVELEAEGPRPLLDTFLELLQRGPTNSHVVRIVPFFTPAEGGFSGFEIRH